MVEWRSLEVVRAETDVTFLYLNCSDVRWTGWGRCGVICAGVTWATVCGVGGMWGGEGALGHGGERPGNAVGSVRWENVGCRWAGNCCNVAVEAKDGSCGGVFVVNMVVVEIDRAGGWVAILWMEGPLVRRYRGWNGGINWRCVCVEINIWSMSVVSIV